MHFILVCMHTVTSISLIPGVRSVLAPDPGVGRRVAAAGRRRPAKKREETAARYTARFRITCRPCRR